jgi:IS5 family transposase
MSLSESGFEQDIQAQSITITVSEQHPLVKLAKILPWQELLSWITPDLQQSTDKRRWWYGRPLQIRIHLGIYLLQQMYNYTDRAMERGLHDNAAFQVFCGYGIVKQWHVPDHTKIEDFRSRLHPETQRKLANQMVVLAAKRGYVNPQVVDIDSTVQEANMGYPARANLLVKLAKVAKRLVTPLNLLLPHALSQPYSMDIKRIKAATHNYFFTRQKSDESRKRSLKQLWREVFTNVLPIMKDSHHLLTTSISSRVKRTVEQLQWKGYLFLEKTYAQLFEDEKSKPIYAFHLDEVDCFNKNKLNKKLDFGRHYQLGRLEGNFLYVGGYRFFKRDGL